MVTIVTPKRIGALSGKSLDFSQESPIIEVATKSKMLKKLFQKIALSHSNNISFICVIFPEKSGTIVSILLWKDKSSPFTHS